MQPLDIFLLSSVGSGSDTLYTCELWGESKKKDTDLRSESSYSSLAQSVERMTVNHDVAGSSPAGGAKKKARHSTCFFLSNPKDWHVIAVRCL